MKAITNKRVIATIMAICVTLLLFAGASVFGVSAAKSSESVSELSATYSYVENDDLIGSLAVNAVTEGINADDYLMFEVYQNVNSIADPTNARTNAQIVTKGFYASDVVNGTALTKTLPLTPLKLKGKAVLGIQVANRGDKNDWVYTYITAGLKLDANGGKIQGSDEIQAKLGFSLLDEIAGKATAVKDYHKFLGWSTTKDGKAIDSEAVMTQYGATLYAVWEQLTTEVSFNIGEATGTVNPIVCNLGEEVTLPIADISLSGNVFVGWATEPAGEVVYQNGDKVTFTAEGPTTLYAIFEKIKEYTVSFDPNGGNGSMDPMTVQVSVPAALSTNTFIKSGAKFEGWATEPAGPVVYEDGATVTLTDSNLTLYAVWYTPNVAVYYISNDGEGTMNPRKAAYQEKFYLDECSFTRLGYKFIGWSLTPDGAVAYKDCASFTMGDKNVTLYAVWKMDFTVMRAVIYCVNGGYGDMKAQVGLFEDVPTTLMPCLYYRPGYSFAGWSRSSSGPVEYSDLATYIPGKTNEVLFAIWTRD